MEEQLALVDVHTGTVADTWPLILGAVQRASFIALDLELSGLGSTYTQAEFEVRYKIMRDVADSHAVLSLGVACFQWAELHSSGQQLSCEVEVFNIWLLSQRPYVIDPKSSKFLINHGFDFNKQFAKGLPYTPGFTEGFRPADHTPQALLAHILTSKKPVVVHNGLVDVLFLYHSFYTSLPPSCNSFLADLTELFQGGVYDTKAIAEYKMGETASFLEYIFRKSQKQNAQLRAEGRLHLKLCPVDYSSASASYRQLVSITPPPVLTADEIVKIQLCKTFASYGFCNNVGCQSCHDVMVVLAQEGLWGEVCRERRKRKRAKRKVREEQQGEEHSPTSDCSRVPTAGELVTSLMKPTAGELVTSQRKPMARELVTSQRKPTARELVTSQRKQSRNTRKRKKKCKREDSEVLPGSVETGRSQTSGSGAVEALEAHSDSVDDPESGPEEPSGASMAELFQEELETAKLRLQSSTPAKRPSFGHRAGFDAFMTGYAFAFYILKQLDSSRPDDSSVGRSAGGMLEGLAGMRNKLANRGKTVPLLIAKSHFARTSEGHRKAWNRTCLMMNINTAPLPSD